MKQSTWKVTTLKAGAYETRELLVPVFVKGELVYEYPKTSEIKAYAETELNTLWDEHRRLTNPQEVYVDLSEKLYLLREKMIRKMR